MPEIKTYNVTQTREVVVTANDPEGAIRIGNAAFEKGQNVNGKVEDPNLPEGVWGNTSSRINVTDLSVRETY